MCGIISIVNFGKKEIDNTKINCMLSSLSKRGPDESKFVEIGDTILGQTRLSIVDIATGHQPMKDNTRPYTIVFNGEIYDYKITRRELELKGHKFSTNSDTEVILKAYTQYGSKCVEYLDGMFAFAIWDEIKKELFIARDRFGKKPFYYTWVNGNFYGVSEIKAFFSTGFIKGKVDLQVLDNYLQLMYIPPWKTIYSNIQTLPPAHAGILKNGEFKIWKYWELKKKPINISYSDAKKEIKQLFENAVQKRMIADVEIGALLSGGVDSTLVCTYAQKYSKKPLKTFSVGYENYINELPFAKQASEKIGTDHYTLNATGNIMVELEKIIEYMDEPHADSSNFPQHLISELASSKVKVALSGDGADELFMGYGWYWKYWNTSKIIRLKNMLFSNQFKEHLKNIAIFSRKDRLNLWKDSSVINTDIERGSQGNINLFDLTTYLPGQLLTKIDRTSMMHSVEIRSPFLDYKLAEYVFNLPEKYKMDKKSGKIILKDILTEIMPKEFVYRKKQGFGAPINEWLKKDDVKKYIEKTIYKSESLNILFKKEEISMIFDEFYKNSQSGHKIWSLLCLSIWFKYNKKY
ncbi:MAG: asparagine synthase (glutamine-hydrolyzing), partial [Patescibacteria group bacterium]